MKFGVFIFLIVASLISCDNDNSNKKSPENNGSVKIADIPKDSLIAIIKAIANYISLPNANDSGIKKELAKWDGKYKITIYNKYEDSLAYIHFGGGLERIDSLDNEISLNSDKLDSTSWLTLTDLTHEFGPYEKGVFDRKHPLPKEPGWYAIYTFRGKSGVPIYIAAHLYGNDIYKIWIKRKWHFSWLLNRDK